MHPTPLYRNTDKDKSEKNQQFSVLKVFCNLDLKYKQIIKNVAIKNIVLKEDIHQQKNCQRPNIPSDVKLVNCIVAHSKYHALCVIFFP